MAAEHGQNDGVASERHIASTMPYSYGSSVFVGCFSVVEFDKDDASKAAEEQIEPFRLQIQTGAMKRRSDNFELAID